MARRDFPCPLILLLAAFALAACAGSTAPTPIARQSTPGNSVRAAPPATPTDIPIALSDGALTWQSPGQPCTLTSFGPGGLEYGLCGAATTHFPFPADRPALQAADLSRFVRTYATLDATTASGKVSLAGEGKAVAGPAEQRMLAEWAELAWRLASQPADPSLATPVFTLHREGGDANLCDEVSVYRSGAAYVTSCWHGQTRELGRSLLGADDLQSIFTWADGLKSFEIVQAGADGSGSPTVRLSFSGLGAAQARHSDILSMRLMAFRLLAHPHS